MNPIRPIDYSRLGYCVLPCRPGAKVPLTTHGCLDATTNLDQIRDWWRRWPDANIAIATVGLVVIDVDPGGLCWPSDDERRSSIRKTGCPVARTPRGGFHLFFRQPPGRSWGCSVGRLAPGVDVRADGGYVLVAPSTTEHGNYRWLRPLIARDRLPYPPTWLCDALDALERRSAPASRLDADRILVQGERNAGLASLAGRLRRAGCTPEELEAALLALNAHRCRPPLSEAEVKRIAKSIARYPPGPDVIGPGLPYALQRAWRHAVAHKANLIRRNRNG